MLRVRVCVCVCVRFVPYRFPPHLFLCLSLCLNSTTKTVPSTNPLTHHHHHHPKTAPLCPPPPNKDDLEVEIVAALEAQLQQESREISAGNVDGSWATTTSNAPAPDGDAGAQRKIDQHAHAHKKGWKNAFGWKYSPGGKQSSIEEEPDTSVSPRQSSSRLSSPANSPKRRAAPTAATLHTSASAQSSPLRRQRSPSPSTRSAGGHGPANRASAGARLCQMIDDSQDESGDELLTLLATGRPASVHIVQATSSQPAA